MNSPSLSVLRSAPQVVPGLAAATALAIVATLVGTVLPLVGSAVSGIVLGAVIGALVKPGPRWQPGIRFASRFVLQLSVVILGTRLSISEVARVGWHSLPVMVGTLLVCLLAAWAIGRALGVVGDLRTLIGVGTGICGASAIAATAPVIGAVSADVAYAVSTIFVFNLTAVVVFPLLGHLLGLSQHAFGLFAGTAVNDTSSVVATATTYGSSATDYAVVVKLVRTLMIIPISIGLAALVARGGRASAMVETDAEQATLAPLKQLSPGRVVRLVPWFLIGFVVMALINSAGLIPRASAPDLTHASVFLIAVALSAIGLSTDLAALRRAGPRPLVLGAALWVTVSAASLGLQYLTGTL